MSVDFEDQESLNTDEQYGSDHMQAYIAHVENRLKHLHTALPGIVQSYDAAKNLATIQPAIKRVFVKSGPTNLPLIQDVPVLFMGAGDFTVTFPVRAGDECLIIFVERALNFWKKAGGVQQPSNYRLHDLSDAVALVGLRSQARNLSSINTDAMELRNADRTVYIQIGATGIKLKGAVTIEGDITQTGTLTQTSGGIITDGNISTDGDLTTSHDSISLHDHVHSGVTTGSGSTGPAVG